ncbi:hypothetical protein LTR62_003485 [Meristemomyces frigidus]|uniref:FAD-binding FR-type domain-containing protein n=1 Tax=Meristemomyces frigidus TaxID=1508187 RepID=A0AAN7TIN4_9PEZI|nr:hypothetical protein LTR62_003485 [Meristemomyces frigidus]
MTFFQPIPWHEGEQIMHEAMGTSEFSNPTIPAVSPQLTSHLKVAPTIAIGTLDKQGRPWTTLWGGEKGFGQVLTDGIVAMKTAVTGKHDPVIELLVGNKATGEIKLEEGKGRMVSGLTIDLMTRKRVKMFGRMIAGTLTEREDEITGNQDAVVEIQLVMTIEQSLANCPKYLNGRRITPTFARPRLIYDAPELRQDAKDLLNKADMFFMTTVSQNEDMDTNHRGGPAGFVRVFSDGTGKEPAAIYWPEYSGNKLYQSLGNMTVNPVCGICIPDFDTGNMLYLTGTTKISMKEDASAILPKTNLCVKVTITSARFVTAALPFRGNLEATDPSPYNPQIRYLKTEKAPVQINGSSSSPLQPQQATLLSQVRLTPTISRFRFRLPTNATAYKAGQYVTLDFSQHLDIGWSHMRDDDPRSINDDFVRTFTVSSPPPPRGTVTQPGGEVKEGEFEVTVRNVGVVTEWMFKHAPLEGSRERARMGEVEVRVLGFGGEFAVQQEETGEKVWFVAAGVGITPLLSSVGDLHFARVRVLWTLRAADLGFALDLLTATPEVAQALTLFVTGSIEEGKSRDVLEELRRTGAKVVERRMQEGDLEAGDVDVKKYYLCTGVPMRKQLTQWLSGKELIFEDFNF